MPWVHTLTGIGDLAVLVPLIAILSVWLLLARQLVALCWWSIAVAICAGATAILKIYFYVCPLAADFSNPSGHTSLSTLVYGSLALIIARSVIGWRRYLIALLGAAVVFGIGMSRVLVQVHSLPEVLVGWLIGGFALWTFARGFGIREYPYLRGLIAACAVVTVSLTGQEVRAEKLLHVLGLHLLDMGFTCINLRQISGVDIAASDSASFVLAPPQRMQNVGSSPSAPWLALASIEGP
jgi:membrane-associated phospholipid phosphatase